MIEAGAFTKEMWQNSTEIYSNIINSDFVKGLAKGDLAERSFKHYLSQDILYIQQDAIALELLSKRANNNNEKDFFLKMSKDCIEIENILHDEFLDYFKIKKADSLSPAFSAYTKFLIDMSKNAPYPIAVAALLPCFWVYGKVGIHIIESQSPCNKYQKFINTYSGDEYNDYTREFIKIVERQGQNANKALQKKMIETFKIGSNHEFSVFEEAIVIDKIN